MNTPTAKETNIIHGPWPSAKTKQKCKVNQLLYEVSGVMTEVLVIGYSEDGKLVFKTTHNQPADLVSTLKAAIRFVERRDERSQ